MFTVLKNILTIYKKFIQKCLFCLLCLVFLLGQDLFYAFLEMYFLCLFIAYKIIPPKRKKYDYITPIKSYLFSKYIINESYETIVSIYEYDKKALTFFPTFRHEMIQYYLYWRRFFGFLFWIYQDTEQSWYEQDHPAKFRRHVFERDMHKLFSWIFNLPKNIILKRYKLYKALWTNQDARNLYREKWTTRMSGFTKSYISLRNDISRGFIMSYLLYKYKYRKHKPKDEQEETKL